MWNTNSSTPLFAVQIEFLFLSLNSVEKSCPTKLNSNSPCPSTGFLPKADGSSRFHCHSAGGNRSLLRPSVAGFRGNRRGPPPPQKKSEAIYITYKGPKIDSTTKTRREIELLLGPGPESLASWQTLLEAIGFRPVAEVRKSRRKAAISWQGRQVEACLDDVHAVGTFVEFELVVEQADVDAARACIQSLGNRLG